MSIPRKDIQVFQKEILEWYTVHKRDLPWRKTRDPYHILISEVMAQQTQLSRVIPKYEAWLQAFPTIEHLSKARVSDVLRMWSGLGYNRRALYVKRFAETVMSQFDGMIPKEIAVLKTLPAIGEYTARAIACFAYNQQVAVVDANVRKVIALKFFNGTPPNQKKLQEIADQLLPKGKAYEWNQALMDYCSMVLKKDKVPVPRQSKFKGSYRYFRGLLLKTLLEKNKLTITEIKELFTQYEFPTERVEKLVEELAREGFVKKTKAYVLLAQ